MEHLPDGALQKGHTARVPRAVPRVGAVGRVVRQCPEERGREALQILARLTHDVAGHELGRVLEHVNEAVQLAQHVVRNGGRRLGFPVKENGHVRVGAAHLMHKGAQFGNRLVFFAGVGKIVVVQAHDEGRGTAGLTRQAREVGEVRDGAHLMSLRLNGLGEVSNAEA